MPGRSSKGSTRAVGRECQTNLTATRLRGEEEKGVYTV